MSGVDKSYLWNNSCLQTCPTNFVPNNFTHKCDCLSENFYLSGTLFELCLACHVGCKVCTGSSQSSCSSCNLGFYLYEPDSLTVCNSTCPAGQFASELELAVCILCDSTKCLECVNSSSICTVCHPNVGVWLFNATCMTQCPDGYEANNITFECDKCALGTFSFLSKCITECPLLY